MSSALRGDFAAAHLAGDNAHVLATDTQQNTVFEGTVLRDDAPDAGPAWIATPGFG